MASIHLLLLKAMTTTAVLALLALASAFAVATTATTGEPATTDDPTTHPAPFADAGPPTRVAVTLDGRTLLLVRGVASYSATERAAAIRQRLEAFAADRAAPVETIQLQESPLGTALQAGTVLLLTVTDADAEVEGISRQVLAGLTREAVVRAIIDWREQREPGHVWRGVAWLAAATLLLLAALRLLSLGIRRLRQRALARVGVHGVQFRAFELLDPTRLQEVIRTLFRTLFWAAALVSLYIYLQFALSLFPWTRVHSTSLLGLVIDPLSTLGLGFIGALPELFFLIVLVFVVRYLLKLVHALFAAVERGTVRFEDFDPDWAIPTYKIVRVFIIAFAVVVAYPYIPGSDSAAFKGVSVLLGVLLSLGSSSVISNVISGYTMTYRRAFRVGDRIRVGDTVGHVVDTRLLETSVRTPKNELVVVPNSEILTRSLVNYSRLAREHGLILHTTVGIGYETPWRQVEAMLLEAAGRTEGLCKEPAPFVLKTALGDFCVTYEINAYTYDTSAILGLYSALHSHILDVFNEYGVQIMTPAYVSDPEVPKVVPPDQGRGAPPLPAATAGGPATG